jgi:hypothetical protein
MSTPMASAVLAHATSRERQKTTKRPAIARAERAAGETNDDELCSCGHRRSGHADPSSGDTRCLAVEDGRDLLEAFDDGREHDVAYCGCLRFTAAEPIAGTTAPPVDYISDAQPQPVRAPGSRATPRPRPRCCARWTARRLTAR